MEKIINKYIQKAPILYKKSTTHAGTNVHFILPFLYISKNI